MEINQLKSIIEATLFAAGRPVTMKELILNLEILNLKTETNKLEQIKYHINTLLSYYPEIFVVKHMRKHILWYLKGERNCSAVKAEICKLTKINDVINVLENFYKNK